MRFSKRFKRAWMKSNQRMHDMLLARPKTKFLQRWPDPALERTLPAPVSAAALRAKASSRTLRLARPKPPPPPGPPPARPGWVELEALRAVPTKRVMELARPVARPRTRASRRSSPGSPRAPKAKKKLYDAARCEALAHRKLTHKPPEEEKKPPKPLNELLPRIRILCELPRRYQGPDLPTVPRAKKLKVEGEKGYEASERTRFLAQPRQFADFKLDEDFDPYLINPGALTYQATDNIKKLAEPRHKEEKRIKK